VLVVVDSETNVLIGIRIVSNIYYVGAIRADIAQDICTKLMAGRMAKFCLHSGGTVNYFHVKPHLRSYNLLIVQ
jgi:hypothetical protein